MKRKFGVGLLIVTMVLFTQLSSALAEDSRDDDGRDSREKYSAWGDQWWKYAFSLSQDDFNQFFALTGDCVHTNQNYEVFFLAGIFGQGSANRTCTIKAGTRLFFPLLNQAFGEDPKYYTRKSTPPYVPATFIKWINEYFSRDNGTSAFASLDNIPLVSQNNQDRFYVTTKPGKALTFTWPAYIFGSPIVYENNEGGFYLSLKLPARSQPYSLHFGGNVPNGKTFTTHFPKGSLGYQDFGEYYQVPFGANTQDITYTITVK